MSDNVIDLGAERDGRRLIVVCDCGCTTHHHYVDGSIACAACETVMTVATSEWRERLGPAPAEARPADDGCFKVIPITTAKQSLLRWAKSPDVEAVRALVLVFEDGQISTSRIGDGFTTEEQRKWLADRFSDAFDHLIS